MEEEGEEQLPWQHEEEGADEQQRRQLDDDEGQKMGMS